MIQQYLDRQMENAGDRIAHRLQQELKIAAPVDDAQLRKSIIVIYADRMLKVFGVDYILHVEFGTRPHIIKAKNKKALAFRAGGKNIIVKQVNHPGTRANPFVRDTVFKMLKKIVIEELNR